MSAIKLDQFGGMLPAWDGHLLPPGQAQLAQNGYLFGGNLIAWRKPTLLRALDDPDARKVYRIPTVSQNQAGAFLVFLVQPADGDSVAVGDLTYTFRTALAVQDNGDVGLPQEVLIGASTSVSATNLVNAITADNGTNTNSGVTYGSQTAANGEVKWYAPDLEPQTGLAAPSTGSVTFGSLTYSYVWVGSTDFGASFNLIEVSASDVVKLLWLADLNSVTDTAATYTGGTNPSFDSRITGSAKWLEFKDADTDVIKSPVVDDQFQRFYFASPSRMPEYNTYDRIMAGDPPWLLGIPSPGCAPTLSVTGGGNNLKLGNFTSSGGKVDGQANWVYLMPIETPGDTQIQDVNWRTSDTFFDEDNNSAHWQAVVYTDNDGVPGSLLNQSDIKQGVLANEPNIAAFTNPTNLLGNTRYWIGFSIDTAIPLAGGPAGGGNNQTSTFPNTFTNGPPGDAPGGAARTTLTTDGTNMGNGDVVTIGLFNYKFQTVLTNVPQNVLIGPTAIDTLQNLADAINLSGTAGVQYAAATTQNTVVEAHLIQALTLPLVAKSHTTVGANVTTKVTPATGTAHLAFSGPVMLDGLTLNQPGLNMWADFVTSDVIESRSYVYTWVSAYGEEGPPSPPTLLDGWSNGTWTLGLWQPPPNDLGVLRNLKSINIYRTVVGQGGATVFFFVTTVPIGTAQYVDSNPDNTVALNDPLGSTNYFPPPENLQGLTVLPNGMVVGFVNNEIWFCEPYRPHAWPPGYVLTVDFPIVGLGVTNGALIVCTNSNPYVITGISPGQMAQSKCSDPNPCSSRASILGGDVAVSYMSPNGLIQVTAAGAATNTTDLWFTREKWQQLTPQRFARAIYMSSCYYCLGSVSPQTVLPVDTTEAQQGFTVELDQDNTSFTIWPQPGGHRLGFMPLNSPVDDADVYGLGTDPWTGIGWVVANGNLYYWDFSNPQPFVKVAQWKSKTYQQNAKRNYSAMKVWFKVPPNTPAQNPTVIEADADDPVWNQLPEDSYGFVKTYVDVDGTGELTLIDAREIRASGGILRIISGFKAEQWAWEIISRVNISNVQIATSPKELANV